MNTASFRWLFYPPTPCMWFMADNNRCCCCLRVDFRWRFNLRWYRKHFFIVIVHGLGNGLFAVVFQFRWFCNVWFFIFIEHSLISIMFATAFWFHIRWFCNLRWFVFIARSSISLRFTIRRFCHSWFPSLLDDSLWLMISRILSSSETLKSKSALSRSFSASWGISLLLLSSPSSKSDICESDRGAKTNATASSVL